MSRTLAALIAVGCLGAAAGGSYVAVRQNAAQQPVAPVSAPLPSPASAPVHETEALIEAPQPLAPEAAEPPPAASAPRPADPKGSGGVRERRPAAPPVIRTAETASPAVRPAVTEPLPAPPAPPAPLPATATADPVVETPARPHDAEPPVPEPVIEEIVIPASAVIGLELETTVSSETARIEDRVDARVTRDVFADGRLALPAGSRVIGGVTLVERGGKVKERARLGVRFHTVVLASGRQVRLRTEPIFREGDSPANESSRKIGGAAIGGAVLGAILGGGKGALAGATAGAAGGTAVVMAGDRNPAVLASGSTVTVKLTAPASLDVERY